MAFTVDQLEQALVGAKTYKDVIQNLGLNVNNGQYRALRGHYLNGGVELPKFVNTGYGNLKTHVFVAMPDEQFFVAGTPRNGVQLKNKLVKAGLPLACADCGLGPEWNSKPLTLQVDHIDGDRFNNVKSNLQLLCPNCHSQTSTFGNGTKQKHYKYCACGVRMHRTSTSCKTCSNSVTKKTVIEWPTPQEVSELVAQTNFSQAGKALGVSDNAVRKYLQRNNMM